MGDHLVKITILLAAYQGEKYLPAQLESLSCQTEPHFQVLFQDDGSTDRTPQILGDWAEKDVRFHAACEQGRHFGAIGNFFSLLRQSDGDLILFCDQDDIWEPEKLALLLRAYQEASASDPDVPILVHSDASIIDENGLMIAPSFFRLEGWDPQAVHLNQLLVQNNATGCMMLLNRPLADLVLRYGDPSRMFMHDWFIALTAAAFGQVVFLNRPLTKYRLHSANVIGASRSSLLRRGLNALGNRKAARGRIALTYTHAEAFREAYGGLLPSAAARIVDDYLSTQRLSKLNRILSVYRLGCLMQSPVTRLGQILFG